MPNEQTCGALGNPSCPGCCRESHVGHFGLGHVRVRCAGFRDFHRRPQAQARALRLGLLHQHSLKARRRRRFFFRPNRSLSDGLVSSFASLMTWLHECWKLHGVQPKADLGRGRRDPFERTPWSQSADVSHPKPQGHVSLLGIRDDPRSSTKCSVRPGEGEDAGFLSRSVRTALTADGLHRLSQATKVLGHGQHRDHFAHALPGRHKSHHDLTSLQGHTVVGQCRLEALTSPSTCS